MSAPTPYIHIEKLRKTFRTGLRQHVAVKDLSLTINKGDMLGLIGASGSGKSTLLRHLCGLTAADRCSGRITVGGDIIQERGRLSGNIRQHRQTIGFIAQQFNLVGRLTLLQNVLIGMLSHLPPWRSLPGFFTNEEKQLAMAALSRVGIADYAAQRASTLSGGQQQRAAIARALVQGAELILADEPIASLDPESSRKVMRTLADINRELGVTVVVCLHQVDFAKRFCPHIVAMSHGELVYNGSSENLDDELLTRLYGREADDAGLIDSGAEDSSFEREQRERARQHGELVASVS